MSAASIVDEFADPYVAAFPETAPFWEASRRGALVLPWCEDCGRSHWHPRPFCPLCGASRLVWRLSTGRGQLYSFSVDRKAAVPVVVAYVALDDGPLLMTNIVGTDPGELQIGQAVQVAFRAAPESRMVPVFEVFPQSSPD
ncbi:Zn-ribbon domain-containing OB-fold protein [Hydrogenophaga sp. BPS33]|uniref:Zn-ribbon domain-containing OB-fold protein n=1 Tax=Hydrogenophaga sp. BPS33 TaxID=2651974 RepID=UPI00131F4FD4|nr:OB-fold domain-containing protein [Hydrogenophaga sp. BPS33]QHE87322.1 hypothetical protein F9K07_21675 [Hydrogenophaga sp. BPS33]